MEQYTKRATPSWRFSLGRLMALLGVFALLVSACSGTSPGGASSGESVASAPVTSSSGDTIKVGILHSLSGTMAISEVSVKDATLLAIQEINANGGVLGKQLEPIIEDGASDWPTFAEKARKLIQQDGVAVVFGCWTSASRKAVLPVFEELNGLLFYPVQYEGLEASPNIFYTGAEPTQQIIPGVDYLVNELGARSIYLLGSDYVFPRTANLIIKAQLEHLGVTLAGEEYVPLGGTEFSTIISKIREARPDAIFNTLNGDSNVAFFKQFKDAGFTAEALPVMSVSVAEEEVRGIGPENIAGHYTAWNYYQTTDTPENKAFVAAYKAAYGEERVTSDPIEAGYFGVYLWKEMVEKAGSVAVDDVRAAAQSGEITFQAPEGLVKVDPENQHTWKIVRIGKINESGLIDEVWSSGEAVRPDPFLKNIEWAAGLTEGAGQ
ncbi:putative ABC transporter substrate binding protein [Caldilinea aerophila DSM 14535 = NBRC 104270]|uniref:Putative ABC transporter substrate binding protein n=2 Tax=Caldilinea aerophila TaxID=133453 RepID=I0HZB7_CALAS|nr:urea ABC transporter substrate-binding protein [Caldilinea aerophila]BAL98354.1 putative ABC transporter substrate binding protein [Caldilinea aerophila DSM 14535 = NBRC 104270]